jgi:phage baseplate assembly protein W
LANNLTKFQRSVLARNSKIADYTPVIAPSGDFKRVTDLETIILSWNNILLTPTRTYTYDPEYGCDLYKKVFEPADEKTKDEIKNEILSKLTQYDPRATITEISIDYLTNKKGFTVSVFASYQGQKGQLQVIVDENLYFRFMEVSD